MSDAEEALTKAADALTDDDYIGAPERARELFVAAPWLATTETKIGGCQNLSYRDLFTLLCISDRLDRLESEAMDRLDLD